MWRSLGQIIRCALASTVQSFHARKTSKGWLRRCFGNPGLDAGAVHDSDASRRPCRTLRRLARHRDGIRISVATNRTSRLPMPSPNSLCRRLGIRPVVCSGPSGILSRLRVQRGRRAAWHRPGLANAPVLAEEQKSPSASITRNAPQPNHRLGSSIRLPADLLPRRTNSSV
jgi:hypothetical protein